MNVLKTYTENIEVPEQKARMTELFQWINTTFPDLEAVIKWNQPMFTHHGTFIIGFSRAKQHLSFTPEEALITYFLDDIKKSGYKYTKGLVKIKWTEEIDFKLIKKLIEFNLKDKAECTTFFRR